MESIRTSWNQYIDDRIKWRDRYMRKARQAMFDNEDGYARHYIRLARNTNWLAIHGRRMLNEEG